MTNVARLSNTGELFAFEFDDNTNSSFSVSKESTVFSNEFDENTSTTLSGSQRMSATSSGGVIVLDSINEIDPYGEIPTDGLQLHLDSVDSDITSTTGSGGSLSISNLANISDLSTSNVSSTTIDCSTVTSSDLYVVTYQAESEDGSAFTCDINGTTASVAISNSNTSGNARVGIFYVEGSVVAGDSTTSTSISSSNSNYRGSFQAFRLVNGSGATVADTDVSESSSQNSQTNTVDFSSGVLFTTGYFSDGQGHSFTGGTSTEYTGVQNGNGSGDGAINTTPTTSSHTVTYTHSEESNTQGDALATAVFTGGGSTTTYYWEDISGNNRDAVFKGTSSPDNPQEGNFVDFDSTNNEYAVIDGSATGSSAYAGVTGTSARSVVVGFQLDSLGINQRIFSYGDNTSGNRFTFRITTTNSFRVELGNGYTQTDNTLGLGKYVIVVTVPASPIIGDIRIWINGVEQIDDIGLSTLSPNLTFDTASNNNVSIGAAQHESAPSYTSGQFSKVMIYNRELSDSEIKLIYQSFCRRLV